MQPASRLAQLFNGSRDIGLVPRRDQCQVNIRRRNESNGKVFERRDQFGEFLCNVRSNLDADEYATDRAAALAPVTDPMEVVCTGLGVRVCLPDDCTVVVAWGFRGCACVR